MPQRKEMAVDSFATSGTMVVTMTLTLLVLGSMWLLIGSLRGRR